MGTAKERSEVVRPTEAQLRWAQFQHKKRAQHVREQVERLYQTPASISDVPDANSDDGTTTDDSVGRSSRRQKRGSSERPKPSISRGRRAMLRVSKRAYETRRANIVQHGFQCRDEEVEEEDEILKTMLPEETTTTDHTTGAHRKRQRKRRHTIRRRQQVVDEDERVRRFEAAYHAMMINLAPQQQPEIIFSPSRRWTRSTDAPVAVSIDGRRYDDLKWGFTGRKAPVNSATPLEMSTPIDRRASWLVHLPERQSVSTSRYSFFGPPPVDVNGEPIEPVHAASPGAHMMFFPGGDVKFDELVAELQRREIEHQRRLEAEGLVTHQRESSAAKFRQSYTERYGTLVRQEGADQSPTAKRLDLHHPDSPTTTRTDKSAAQSAPSSPSAESDAESEFWISARNMHDTTATPEEPADPAISSSKRLVPTERSDLDKMASGLNASSTTPRSANKGHRATPHRKGASDTPKSLSSVDSTTGHSHAEDSQKQRRILTPQNGTSPGSPSIESDVESGFWRSARNMHDTTLLDKVSSLTEAHAGEILRSGSSQAASPTVPATSPSTSTSPSKSRSSRFDKFIEKGRSGTLGGRESLSPSSAHPTTAQVSDRASLSPGPVSIKTTSSPEKIEGHNRPDDNFLESGSSSRVGTSIASRTEGKNKSSPEELHHESAGEDAIVVPVEAESSARRSVSARMGGLLTTVFSGKKARDEDELRAVETFRKRQDARRGQNDDGTSVSSFRVLPEGIRRVVKNFSVPKDNKVPQDAVNDQLYDDEADVVPASVQTASISPGRSGISRSGIDEYSPEHGKSYHHRVMEHSVLIGDMTADNTIIDTDDASLVSDDPKMDPHVAASLFLSPTILTKRHQQAIRAIERQKWEQVAYLLSANPWLAEMTDVTTEQYLLHKLALYGGGVPVVHPESHEVSYTEPAPEQLNLDLIRMFPASVHKFDNDGNLPLHMAAVSGNTAMVQLLGERFPSGASVRNEEGLLPLHLAIQACPSTAADGDVSSATRVIKTILRLFPGAVAVAESEGNIPIHCAASSLRGNVGVDVLYMLLDEADRQVQNGMLFRTADSKVKQHGFADDDAMSETTDATATATESSTMMEDGVYCTLVRNSRGHNPLFSAIRARAGWEVIEAIAGGPGGKYAALHPDSEMSNALHLLVSEEFADPAAVLSVLRAAPDAAGGRNVEGVLPIELACMQGMPREVILAMVLVDLPVDLQDRGGVKVREKAGGSWWFLTCECDDHHLDVVLEVMAMCSYPQLRELCFLKGTPAQGNGTVISRATPRCRDELRKALRFLGRFEFVGGEALQNDSVPGLKVFEALDFGEVADPYEEGRRVMLRCYALESTFIEETLILREFDLDTSFVEEAFDFEISEFDDESQQSAPQQFCVVVERPALVLDQVVTGMLRNGDYRTKPEMRDRYLSKVSMVLRLVVKALRHLHQNGVVHGTVSVDTVGKFDDTWKLTDMLGMQPVGTKFHGSRMGKASPPEALDRLRDVVEGASASRHVTFVGDLTTSPAFDMWGFGKLSYEALTGIPLIAFEDKSKASRNDHKALQRIYEWDDDNLDQVAENLRQAGVPDLGTDLITNCLLPDPQERPSDMEEVLKHPFWKDMRRRSAPRKSRPERQPPNEI